MNPAAPFFPGRFAPARDRRAPAASATPAGPRLRLVRGADRDTAEASAAPVRVSEATDPRWVLAVRTAEALEGPVLVPEKRERLLAVGAAVGLTPFDTALVIAMVQDQARRGVAPRQCPSAAEPQLRHVPRPTARRFPWRPVLLTGAGVVLLEAAIVTWWMFA